MGIAGAKPIGDVEWAHLRTNFRMGIDDEKKMTDNNARLYNPGV